MTDPSVASSVVSPLRPIAGRHLVGKDQGPAEVRAIPAHPTSLAVPTPA